MDVLIIAGSSSDINFVKEAAEILKSLNISYDIKILSAHRTPEILMEEIKKSDAKVFITIAGLSAALPGFVAANTLRPVIGVPLSGKVPYDSLLSMVQMPKGVPVAVVGVDNAVNGALLAAQILAINDENIYRRLVDYRKNEREKVIKANESIGRELV